MQGLFSTLTKLFGRVVLWTNVSKTVGVICLPCWAAGIHSDTVYERRMTGKGITYWERHRFRVQCLDCGEEMVAGLMRVHRKRRIRL